MSSKNKKSGNRGRPPKVRAKTIHQWMKDHLGILSCLDLILVRSAVEYHSLMNDKKKITFFLIDDKKQADLFRMEVEDRIKYFSQQGREYWNNLFANPPDFDAVLTAFGASQKLNNGIEEILSLLPINNNKVSMIDIGNKLAGRGVNKLTKEEKELLTKHMLQAINVVNILFDKKQSILKELTSHPEIRFFVSIRGEDLNLRPPGYENPSFSLHINTLCEIYAREVHGLKHFRGIIGRTE